MDLNEIKENIDKFDLIDLASLVVKRFEEYEKNNVEYSDLENIIYNKSYLMFYLSARELDYFNK